MKYQPRRMKKENLDWINMIYASDLSSKAKLVASVLSSYMHNKTEANPGLGRLTEETSLSKRSVQNGIDELHSEGWISKKSGGVTDRGLLLPNCYQLTWPDGIGRAKSPEKTTPHDEQTIAPDAIVEGQTIATGAIGYSTSCHTPIAPVATKLDIELDKNKKESVGTNKFAPPTQQQISDHLITRGYPPDDASDWAEDIFAYYTSNGWKVGRNPMKCWRSAASKWAKSNAKQRDANANHQRSGNGGDDKYAHLHTPLDDDSWMYGEIK